MDAVVLDHVDKTYTTYGTDIVLTGETRPSRCLLYTSPSPRDA